MSISGVNPKCYILALFVRDDGTRFLLGDDPFEFKDNQLHFQQNTIANDVVEVQGNDGYLLAGQVRRPGTQIFDGYVCNGTNSKEEVEVKRRAFLQFFRRSHFYKVIYIFPNGTAIQRKQGFLVDDPTVQELYQQYPEYHVALNFEDVNYYTYEEDDQGHEIYAKEAIVPLAGGGATGGLIWDEYGVVWEDLWSLPLSISGVQFQILNSAGARAPIDNVELYGNTYQQTYSGKNLFNKDTTDTKAINGATYSTLSTGVKVTNSGGSNWGLVLFMKLNAADYVGKTLTFSVNAAPSSTNVPRITFTLFNEGVSTRTAVGTAASGSGNLTASYTVDSVVTATPYIGVSLYGNFQGTLTNTLYVDYTNVQLEVGPATPYEPYTGGIPAPNPDYPQPIQVVTGEQTVTISDGVSSEDFTINLGSTELCKIGDYQDKIFKNDPNEDWYDPDLEDNAWYVHKVCDSSLLGGFTWTAQNTYNSTTIKKMSTDGLSGVYLPPTNSSTTILAYCTHYQAETEANVNLRNMGLSGRTNGNDIFIYDPDYNTSSSPSNFKTWLSNNSVALYYVLATPTDTKITDATLVGQLNALGAMKLFIGENNLLVSTSTPNLPATLAFDYYTKFAAIGAEWEEGGTKGATIVDVDAIDNTYPVWELTGPATNPTLSVLTTNTALTYNGTITASQKLVIDMFNKTATLNGTSVIGNISGDFVYMAPGTNRLAYTAGNTDAPDSTIYWQEVVG